MEFNVKELTITQLEQLIALGDDTKDNQIRITTKGKIFLSSDVGANNLYGILSRFETFDAGNDYIGENASKDKDYINRLYKAIQKNNEDPQTYIEAW